MGAKTMTENPLALQDMQFEVSYTPSKITIENEELLDRLIEQTTDHYNNQVFKFDEENVAEAKQAKADLNKIAKLIDDRRKEIKADYSQPLNIFEEKMKRYVERIKVVSDDINSGIKLFFFF